jgi:hypothetical protein
VLDLVDQVLGVADQRQVALAGEGEAAGVGELLVEADLAGGVGQAGPGRLLQVGPLAAQLVQLGLQPPAVGLEVPLGDRRAVPAGSRRQPGSGAAVACHGVLRQRPSRQGRHRLQDHVNNAFAGAGRLYDTGDDGNE